MNAPRFDWQRFHAYRVFDEFLERFVLQAKSYITSHGDQLDIAWALDEIETIFVSGFDDSESGFEEKVAKQFGGASELAKVVFANVEYLWAMPMGNISAERKLSYARRWFPGADQVVGSDRLFFEHPHTIADPGTSYLLGKYWELVAALRVLSLVTVDSTISDLDSLKQRIAEICRRAIRGQLPVKGRFAVSRVCGIHSALLHMVDPERYESIISATHRRQIIGVFRHVVGNPSQEDEVLLKQIRSTMYESHGRSDEPDRKYRWFFYCKDVHPLWIDKKSRLAQRVSSAVFDVRTEEDALDIEGEREEATGYRIRRSASLVKATKERDGHACRACGFHFADQIVHVHHLDPVSEYKRPQETRLENLLTLCPNCHYLAHYWLRKSDRYKQLEPLLSVLKKGGK
jgi:hypothetical protein